MKQTSQQTVKCLSKQLIALRILSSECSNGDAFKYATSNAPERGECEVGEGISRAAPKVGGDFESKQESAAGQRTVIMVCAGGTISLCFLNPILAQPVSSRNKGLMVSAKTVYARLFYWSGQASA